MTRVPLQATDTTRHSDRLLAAQYALDARDEADLLKSVGQFDLP